MARIRRLLIANRGEIARRVIRTAHQMGITTVAVYAEPDRLAPHVTEADLAVPLGGASPAETYLDTARLLAAARLTGADAVHPGYGFLAENAGFARAVRAAGLVFAGPSPEAIEAMGDKINAKRLAAQAGVPILESVELNGGGSRQLPYPLLVKAAAGGGGRGMRVVRSPRELEPALAGAAREAESAFGDGRLFGERLLEGARHVEIQVLADQHGGAVHMFERDCSVQRRHQKVIEEAPAPGLDPELRERMGAAAVRLARLIGYEGAGTVEFLLRENEFFFLEMNTRLQVEHPVTEEITGQDLVRLQLEIARGARLPFGQTDLRQRGHAIEARLYAENPAAGFLPSPGRLTGYRRASTPGIRYEEALTAGLDVPTEFDPMIAKLIAHADTREEAAARLARALRELQVHGIQTNRDFLVAVLEHPAFLAGRVDTDFIEHHPELAAAGPSPRLRRLHAVAAAIAGQAERRASARVQGFVPSGWRNLFSQPQRAVYETGGERLEVAYRFHRGVLEKVSVAGEEAEVRLVSATGSEVLLEIGGLHHRCLVAHYGEEWYVNSADGQSQLRELPVFTEASTAVSAGGAVAPVPGTVVDVKVRPGDRVRAGDTLLVMEAMKMEHHIKAPDDAVVEAVLVETGQKVDAHQQLVVLGAA